jgi:hypothetical protein
LRVIVGSETLRRWSPGILSRLRERPVQNVASSGEPEAPPPERATAGEQPRNDRDDRRERPAQEVPKSGAETRTTAAATKTTTKPPLTERRTSSPALAYSPLSSYHSPRVSSLSGVGEGCTC